MLFHDILEYFIVPTLYGLPLRFHLFDFWQMVFNFLFVLKQALQLNGHIDFLVQFFITIIFRIANFHFLLVFFEKCDSVVIADSFLVVSAFFHTHRRLYWVLQHGYGDLVQMLEEHHVAFELLGVEGGASTGLVLMPGLRRRDSHVYFRHGLGIDFVFRYTFPFAFVRHLS